MSSGLDDLSLFELFRMEAEEQVRVLQAEIIQLESGAATAATLEALMRAAHSLKGAARIIGLDVIVHLTHAMEDRFVAAQKGSALASAEVDRMLTATDWLARLQATPDAETNAWLDANTPAIEAFTASFTAAEGQAPGPVLVTGSSAQAESPAAQTPAAAPAPEPPPPAPEKTIHIEDEDVFGQLSAEERSTRERTLRISAGGFDQIVSLTSESLVASRKLIAQSEILERNRRAIVRAQHILEDPEIAAGARLAAMRELDRQTAILGVYLADLDQFTRANERTAERLYRTVLAGRLRPFSEGITGVPRLVRDTARDLGKQIHLEVLGESTRVDRDILERLEAPISHLITNAIDHGIEPPAARIAAGKPPEARLRLHARHENGRLVITLRDDGRGIYRDQLRERIVGRNLVSAQTAEGLADNELLEFLFLPGFSTRETVSQISGRGVGLNVVQSMVQEAGGSVTVTSEPGAGTVFRLTLPVTRSVIKAIRLQTEGEFYAVPLVRIDRVALLEPIPARAGESGPPTVEWNEQTYPVVALGALLGLSTRPLPAGAIPMLLSGGIAFAVDRLVDETELPIRRLDRRLGKIPGVSAASLDETGLPLLILDMEDLILSAQGRPASPSSTADGSLAPHVLVVDDSHTVREMERRLLDRAGYIVTTAQNGQEAWNLLRLNDYDLLISDVDMPQMNGIELVTKVRENPRLSRMPVIILSYKANDDDRRRGLDAGADFYLTKGDFQNNTFLQAVIDLIGTAEPLASGHAEGGFCVKVAIVNDSKTAAEVLRRILAQSPEFQLAWIAYSGEEALELCSRSHPDIILMDLIMPGIDGAETTRRIMQTTPCVILVVTATTVGNRDQVFEAMGHGALDAVNTPTLGPKGDMAGAEPLLQKLRTVARLVSPQRAAHPPHTPAAPLHRLPHLGHFAPGLPVVAIGASTGGPQALAQILSHLPADFPAAILVTQHVDEHFAPGLAAWLQHHSALPVRIARAGDLIHAGEVWIAGSSDHLGYEEAGGTLYYTPDPIDTPYRPSVDVLFASLAHARHVRRIGVLLTGMGRDGAAGLLALRKSGAHTIAQDAETSVVYGMPRAAADLKAAIEILPLQAIGPRLRDLVLQPSPESKHKVKR